MAEGKWEYGGKGVELISGNRSLTFSIFAGEPSRFQHNTMTSMQLV